MATLYKLSEVVQKEILDQINDNVPEGLPSGLGIEKLVRGGIPRDKVTVLFADTATFKTTVANHVLLTIAESGSNILNVTLEDSARLLACRYISLRTGIPYGDIAGGIIENKEWLRNDFNSRAARNYYVTDDIEPTFDRIRDAVAQVPGCACVCIDYAQLLGDKGTQKETLDYAVVQAQALAKKVNCSVLLISQMKLDRQDYIDNPRPQLRDLFGSSALRTGAKLTLGLFRPFSHVKAPVNIKGPYGPYAKFISSNPENVDMYEGIVEVHVLKNNTGSTGFVQVHVDGPTGRIKPVDMRDYL